MVQRVIEGDEKDEDNQKNDQNDNEHDGQHESAVHQTLSTGRGQMVVRRTDIVRFAAE